MLSSRPFRTPSQLTLADPDLGDAGGSTSDDSNLPQREWRARESRAAIRRRTWSEKGQSNTDHSSQSQSTPIPPSTESKVDTRPPPNSAIPSIHLNSITVPSPERVPAIGPVQDNFTEPWEAVKDIPKIARGAFDTLGASAAFSLIFYHALILDTRRHSYYDPNWRQTVHSHHQGNCHNG